MARLARSITLAILHGFVVAGKEISVAMHQRQEARNSLSFGSEEKLKTEVRDP
jgi:hypothetical protein